jgi:ABC-type transport system involved in multi-copper enzyme maturation permease subunit
MVGAVLHQEWLLGSRRERLHLLRWVWAAWLIFLVFFGYVRHIYEQTALLRARAYDDRFVARASAPEIVGQWFAETFVAQMMLFLVLATPAFVAGAITDEKRRGTLQYLLTADLEARHIILGKLLGRVARVLLVAVAGLPLFALLAGFGGLQPITLLAVAIALLMPLFALASATLLASVWSRQTRDAVLALYGLGTLGGLAVWYFRGPLSYLDPLFVIGPAWGAWRSLDLGELSRRLLVSSACWGLMGGVCLALAAWRLRPAYVRELENVQPARRRWYSNLRAPVRDEPVRWRERHVEGLAPTLSLRRIPQWLAVSTVVVLTTVSSLVILALSLPPSVHLGDLLLAVVSFQPGRLTARMPAAGDGFLVQGLVVMLLASLVVGIRCSGAVTGERERQTWEALLMTPLSAKQLIRGKLWGILGASYVYLLAYAAPAIVLSVFGGVLALVWVLLWLAVTVLAMYYIGAAGLWASVRAKNSWRALLGTMAAGYAGGLALYACSLVVILPGSFIVGAILTAIDKQFGTQLSAAATPILSLDHRVFFVLTCLGLALIFWLTSRLFLHQALRWVADRERTRHWYEEPVYRRSRRRPVAAAGRGAVPGG